MILKRLITLKEDDNSNFPLCDEYLDDECDPPTCNNVVEGHEGTVALDAINVHNGPTFDLDQAIFDAFQDDGVDTQMFSIYQSEDLLRYHILQKWS